MTTHGGRTSAGLDALGWAVRAAELGAGEILLNAMDADGTQDGFDLELIELVRREVSVPVIASGGAGALDHFAPAVAAGAARRGGPPGRGRVGGGSGVAPARGEGETERGGEDELRDAGHPVR